MARLERSHSTSTRRERSSRTLPRPITCRSCGESVQSLLMSGDRAERAEGVLEIDLAGIVANWRLLARRGGPARSAGGGKAGALPPGRAREAAAPPARRRRR